ncbi:MAG: hypothetical protein MZU91_13585 [Desulfosudis oleivorans]|nr:hypothetical protein [Desulfosudis oleivorans]
MLTYADRPLRVDTSCTRQKLDWRPRDEYSILNRLPVADGEFPTPPPILARPATSAATKATTSSNLKEECDRP